jgi:putative nucleotidyltransferase with HDIG domain
MRLVTLPEYDHLTMQLARPIYDNFKRVLLAPGRTIHPKFLERLAEFNITYLFVEDAVSEGITMEELVDMPTWMDAVAIVQKCFEDAEKKKVIDFTIVQQLTNRLLDEVNKRKTIVLIPSTAIPENLRLFAHSVNVALLALQLGKKLGYNALTQKKLAIGCLLHDIGMVTAKNNEDHAQAGFDYLRNCRDVNILSAHIAYQHHELADGSGTPRGIDGKSIQELAQVCGIANLYENLISRDNMPPHEAMEMIMTKNGVAYKEEIVHAFVDAIPPYNPGTTVKLTTGKEAIVTKVDVHMQRPHVRTLDTGEEISLAEHPSILIVGIVK